MAFDIRSLQRNRAPVQAKSKADELAGRAVLKYIDVDDLVPSEDNFYSMPAIEELAALIEIAGGVKQAGLVVPLGGGKYKLLAGHRRRLASLHLVSQGKEEYRKMPCMVEEPPAVETTDAAEADEAAELRKIDEAILLIATNGQREKTDWDKVQEATRLRELLERKRRFAKIPGQTRKIIAEQLGTTPAQVGRYESIDKHLITPFKDWLEQGKVGISVAYELSTLPEDVQKKAAAECWGKRGPVTLEDVRRWKSEAERDEPEPEAGPKCKPGVYVREETTMGRITPPPSPAPAEGITTITADETGPAPTPEQWDYMKGRADAEKNAGKIVDFPALPSPPPVGTGQGEKDVEWATLMLETLRNYCETMAAVKGERMVPWTDYADALDVVLSALRK